MQSQGVCTRGAKWRRWWDFGHSRRTGFESPPGSIEALDGRNISILHTDPKHTVVSFEETFDFQAVL